MGELTGALSQLNPTSTFINTLNSSADPQIPYTVLGGDVRGLSESEKSLARLVKKMQLKLSDVMFSDQPHDLFASLESTFNENIWESRSPKANVLPKVACHHFNYFNSDAGISELNKLTT